MNEKVFYATTASKDCFQGATVVGERRLAELDLSSEVRRSLLELPAGEDLSFFIFAPSPAFWKVTREDGVVPDSGAMWRFEDVSRGAKERLSRASFLDATIRKFSYAMEQLDQSRGRTGFVVPREVEYVEGLVQKLYYFFAEETGPARIQLAEVTFDQLVQSATERLSAVHPDLKGRLRRKGEEQLWTETVYGDREALKLVLGSILSNAAKYTGTEGRIELIMDSDDQWIILRLRNWGPPLTNEEKNRIFSKEFHLERYTSSKTSGNRYGIGLYYSVYIMQAHRGSLDIASTSEDDVTEFVVRLPRISVYSRRVEVEVVEAASQRILLRSPGAEPAVKELRKHAGDWIAEHVDDKERIADMDLCLTEALTNAVSHGSSSGGDIELEGVRRSESVEFTVRDTGGVEFFPLDVVRSQGAPRYRKGGRGFLLIRELADSVQCAIRPGKKTALTIGFKL